MIEFFSEKYQEMELKMKSISNENKIDFYIDKIKVIEETLDILRNYILQNNFENDEIEIYYFKNLKPTIVSKLVIFKRFLQIEYEKPHGSTKEKIAHLECELNRLTRYCKANVVFVKYIRSGKSNLDQDYFLRRNAKDHQMFESFASEIDYTTGTGFDYRLAVIQAHDKIEHHLQEQIDAIKNPTLKNNFEIPSQYDTQVGKKKMNWTISQADLVELIYGLYCSRALNHGTADIKEITSYFEDVFNVKLNNVYRTFLDIKRRKSFERFSFISSMAEKLEHLADENFISNE